MRGRLGSGGGGGGSEATISYLIVRMKNWSGSVAESSATPRCLGDPGIRNSVSFWHPQIGHD